jgi:hypothetical protein
MTLLSRWAATACLVLPSLVPTGTGRAQTPAAITWETGSGEGVELWRVGLQGSPRSLTTIGGWSTTLAWELQIGKWSGSAGRAAAGTWDVGVTPIIRFEQRANSWWTAFLEGAVGAHLISRNRAHHRLDMSSAYQFGDHIGFGVRLRAVEVVFRHQHMSNASTVQPNHGANFNMLRLVYYLN